MTEQSSIVAKKVEIQAKRISSGPLYDRTSPFVNYQHGNRNRTLPTTVTNPYEFEIL